ncbi:conserved hypothetical protein [Gammaproteobacteria bacterium]
MIGAISSTPPTLSFAYATSMSDNAAQSAQPAPATQTPVDQKAGGISAGGDHNSGCGCDSCVGGQQTGKLRQEQDEKTIKHLKQRDQEVRDHEAAHLAAAGSLAQGGPKFNYQRGPDGQVYAVGGSVAIDVMPSSKDPKETIDKARIIQAAALAPSHPSSQDQAVSSAANQMAQKAMHELSHREKEAATGNDQQTKSQPTPAQRAKEAKEAEDAQSSTSQSPASVNGMSPYVPNETMIPAPARRLQEALSVSTGNSTFGVYA